MSLYVTRWQDLLCCQLFLALQASLYDVSLSFKCHCCVSVINNSSLIQIQFDKKCYTIILCKTYHFFCQVNNAVMIRKSNLLPDRYCIYVISWCHIYTKLRVEKLNLYYMRCLFLFLIGLVASFHRQSLQMISQYNTF